MIRQRTPTELRRLGGARAESPTRPPRGPGGRTAEATRMTSGCWGAVTRAIGAPLERRRRWRTPLSFAECARAMSEPSFLRELEATRDPDLIRDGLAAWMTDALRFSRGSVSDALEDWSRSAPAAFVRFAAENLTRGTSIRAAWVEGVALAGRPVSRSALEPLERAVASAIERGAGTELALWTVLAGHLPDSTSGFLERGADRAWSELLERARARLSSDVAKTGSVLAQHRAFRRVLADLSSAWTRLLRAGPDLPWLSAASSRPTPEVALREVLEAARARLPEDDPRRTCPLERLVELRAATPEADLCRRLAALRVEGGPRTSLLACAELLVQAGRTLDASPPGPERREGEVLLRELEAREPGATGVAEWVRRASDPDDLALFSACVRMDRGPNLELAMEVASVALRREVRGLGPTPLDPTIEGWARRPSTTEMMTRATWVIEGAIPELCSVTTARRILDVLRDPRRPLPRGFAETELSALRELLATSGEPRPAWLQRRVSALIEEVRAGLAALPKLDEVATSEPHAHRRLETLISTWVELGGAPLDLAPPEVRERGGVNVAYEYDDRDVSRLLEPLGSRAGVQVLAPAAKPEVLVDAIAQARREAATDPRPRLLIAPLSFDIAGVASGHWSTVVVALRGPLTEFLHVDTLRASGPAPYALQALMRQAAPGAIPKGLTHGTQPDSTSCGPLMVEDVSAIVAAWQATRRLPAELPARSPAEVVEIRRRHLAPLAEGDPSFPARQAFAMRWMQSLDLDAFVERDHLEAKLQDVFACWPRATWRAFAGEPTPARFRALAPWARSWRFAGPFWSEAELLERAAAKHTETLRAWSALEVLPWEAARRFTTVFEATLQGAEDLGATLAAVRRAALATAPLLDGPELDPLFKSPDWRRDPGNAELRAPEIVGDVVRAFATELKDLERRQALRPSTRRPS